MTNQRSQVEESSYPARREENTIVRDNIGYDTCEMRPALTIHCPWSAG